MSGYCGDYPGLLGFVGDGLIGVLVMNVFFLCCMLLFDRSMLVGDAPGRGVMLILATVAGALGGVWLGRDLKKELRAKPRDYSERTDSV